MQTLRLAHRGLQTTGAWPSLYAVQEEVGEMPAVNRPNVRPQVKHDTGLGHGALAETGQGWIAKIRREYGDQG